VVKEYLKAAQAAEQLHLSYDHDWLEGRGLKIKLIGAIDDATGEVPYAQFAYKDSVDMSLFFFG
jgi:hypothetical protein